MNCVADVKVHEQSGRPLLLSSARTEVKLWDANRLEQDQLGTFESLKSASFSPKGHCFAAVAARQNTAFIFDVATRMNILAIDEPECKSCKVLPWQVSGRVLVLWILILVPILTFKLPSQYPSMDPPCWLFSGQSHHIENSLQHIRFFIYHKAIIYYTSAHIGLVKRNEQLHGKFRALLPRCWP